MSKNQKKLSKNAEFANICYALPSGHGVFQVLVRDYHHIVDIKAKTCDCRRWKLTRIPCSHAISCLRHERIQPESVLPSCYSLDAYNRAYAFSIWPCRDKSEWKKMNGTQVLSPVYEKKAGRPPKSRKKQPFEVPGKYGPKLSRHGITIHCTHCSEDGHNTNGCKLKRMGFSSKDAKQLVATTQATLRQEAEQQARQATANEEAIQEDTETNRSAPLNSNFVSQHTSTEEMIQTSPTMWSYMLGEVIYITLYCTQLLFARYITLDY